MGRLRAHSPTVQQSKLERQVWCPASPMEMTRRVSWASSHAGGHIAHGGVALYVDCQGWGEGGRRQTFKGSGGKKEGDGFGGSGEQRASRSRAWGR